MSGAKTGNATRAAITRCNPLTPAGNFLLGALIFAAAALVLSAAPASAATALAR